MKLPLLELSHWSRSNSFLSRLSYHQLLLFTRDFLPIIVLCAFNLSWYFSSPLLICKCFAVIQSPVYSCYKVQPSFVIWVPRAIWGKGKWSDLSVFDKCHDNRVFQGGDVESTFLFGQENWFIMICDIRSSLNFSLVYIRNEKSLLLKNKIWCFFILVALCTSSLYRLLCGQRISIDPSPTIRSSLCLPPLKNWGLHDFLSYLQRQTETSLLSLPLWGLYHILECSWLPCRVGQTRRRMRACFHPYL